jgi:hypothetical protein
MARHMDAWMDGVKLADVGAILIQQVDESPAEMEITYVTRPIRPGSDVLQNKRKSLKVRFVRHMNPRGSSAGIHLFRRGSPS